MTGWPAVLLAVGFVFLMLRSPEPALRRIGPPATRRQAAAPGRRMTRRTFGMGVVVAAGLVVVVGAGTRLAVIAAGSAGVAWVARQIYQMGRTRRERRARQRRVVALCDALSAELRGGLPMTTAVQRCCGDDAELSSVVRAAALGGDVAGAFRGCARLPGADGLRAVAAAWDIAGTTGSALSSVLDRMASGLRDDDEARSEVDAALGPPRATARMLALLPVFGLGLGASIGAHPVGFLLGSAAGLTCLSGGAALALLGMWWVERLAATAEM